MRSDVELFYWANRNARLARCLLRGSKVQSAVNLLGCFHDDLDACAWRMRFAGIWR